jgi:hypothetical protein
MNWQFGMSIVDLVSGPTVRRKYERVVGSDRLDERGDNHRWSQATGNERTKEPLDCVEGDSGIAREWVRIMADRDPELLEKVHGSCFHRRRPEVRRLFSVPYDKRYLHFLTCNVGKVALSTPGITSKSSPEMK